MSDRDPGEFLALLNHKLADKILQSLLNLGDAEIRIARDRVLEVFTLLRDDPDLRFEMLLSVTVVDYMDHDFIDRAEYERFEVVYHVLSLSHRQRLRVKAAVPEGDPQIDSLCGLWPSADWMEREAWDMFGVVFRNHPNLRRILLYDEFEGYPLRKDYPVQRKQPRIPMRHPEVHNTARDMLRPALVNIRKREKPSEGGRAGGSHE